MPKPCILVAEILGGPAPPSGAAADEARHTLERCRNRIKLAVESNGGKCADTATPELRAGFASADAAVLAACEMIDRVHALPPARGAHFALRVGLAAGDGDAAVTGASRLRALARAGEALLDAHAAGDLSAPTRQFARIVVAPARAGIEPGIEVILRHAEDTLAPAVHPDSPRLRVHHGGRTLYVDETHPRLLLGRDATNDLVIGDPRASRIHATIAHRAGGFVLIDHSSNGCWIEGHDTVARCVKGNEAGLPGRGRLGLGAPTTDGASNRVDFEVG